MGSIVLDISMSLDGFIADRHGVPEGLHDWAFDAPDGTTPASEPDTWRPEAFGAIIAGRRTYDDSLPSWGADGPSLHRRIPVYVVSHSTPDALPADGVYTFVGDLADAVSQARERADGKSVSVMDGGELGGRMLAAGLLDEVKVHLVPVVLGAGTPLFGGVVEDRVELEPVEVERGTLATHLRYRVRRAASG